MFLDENEVEANKRDLELMHDAKSRFSAIRTDILGKDMDDRACKMLLDTLYGSALDLAVMHHEKRSDGQPEASDVFATVDKLYPQMLEYFIELHTRTAELYKSLEP